MYLARKYLIAFAGVLILTLVIWFHQVNHQKWNEVLENTSFLEEAENQSAQESSTIHIVHLIKGEPMIERAVTLLKSVFYFQGRLQSGHHLQRIPLPLPCLHSQVPHSLHVHLITERKLWWKVNSSFSQWRATQLTWTVYDLDAYLPLVNWIPNAHQSGVAALLKMFVPEILPTNVEKAVVLDTDILLNANIVELWEHFTRFNMDQIFGAVWVFDSTNSNCSGDPIPPSGVNSGVVLMHLRRMREAYWTQLFKDAVQEYLSDYSELQTGEQSALILLIRRHPKLYYHLPCEWNVHLWPEDVRTCCPLIWTNRGYEVDSCQTRASPQPGDLAHPGSPKLVHYSVGGQKLELENNPGIHPSANASTKDPQTRDQLRARFVEVYWSFKPIPQNYFD